MKKRILIPMFASVLVLVGCSKDFLEAEPTQLVSSEQIQEATEKNPSLQIANIAGLYSTMYLTGTGGTGGHDDFGQKGYDIFSDMLTGDMVLAGYTYGWYQDIVEYLSTTDFTYTDNYQVWRYYYRIIFGANNVIDGFGGTDVVPESEEGQHIVGQAKVMRAYSYFYLLQFLGNGYNPTEPVLPLYTGVATEAAPLSTQQEIYDLVVSDLTQSIDLLEGFTRTAKNQVDVSIAKGLLAYTYAAMGDYEQVKTLTQDVINTGGYTLAGPEEITYNGENLALAGMNDVASPSWMWGVDLTLDIGLDLVSWWGQVDLTTYSYAWAGDPKTMSADLYAQIPEDDVRKGQWVDVYQTGVLYPINKFYHEARQVAGQRNLTTDYVYMRIAEMYFLLAEAAYMTGDEALAQQTLKEVVSLRVPDASYIDALSGQALMDEIYLQMRIEHWGEGKVYLAVKRLEKTVTMPPNHLTFPGLSVSYDSDEMDFEIPLAERQNNPNISF